MKLESTFLDKLIHGAFLGKRQIGRPLKYNFKNKLEGVGTMELYVNPRNKFERYVSRAMRVVLPYLNYITYRFHVEKAREGGFRIEDVYH